MPSYNQFTLMGHLGNDPDLKTAQTGTSICRTSMAINGTGKNRDVEPIWMRMTAFGKTAELLAQNCQKGDCILVTGTLQPERWEKDGVKKESLAMLVDKVSFVKVTKNKDEAPRKPAPKQDDGVPSNLPDDMPF